MPKVSMTLPENIQAISRPVVIDIVNQLKSITKIPTDTPIFFPGDSERMKTVGSEVNSEADRTASFETNRLVFIEVEEDHNVDDLSNTAVHGQGAKPVFMDKDLGVYVTPIYTTTDLKIALRYRTHSRTEAMRWRDDIRLRLSQMRDVNTHTIKYHYLLPGEVLILLKQIYEHREAVEPYNQDFVDYFKARSTDRLTLVSGLSNKDSRLGIAETQNRIYGYYEFEPLPDKPEKDNDKGVWTVTLNYKLTYDKPYACHVKYPVMVHNQLLPFAYTAFTDSSPDLNKTVLSFQGSLYALRAFENDVTMDTVRDPQAYIKLPEFDDYVIPGVVAGTGTIMMALTQVEDDKRTLLNLRDMDPIVLDEDILTWIMEEEYAYVCNRYKSIIQIDLYRNNTLTQNTPIICDASLNIKTTTDLNLRNQHRLRLGLVTDISYLDEAAIKRLKSRPKVFVKIIGAMNELLKNHPDFNKLADTNRISEYHFSEVFKILTGYRNGSPNNSDYYYGPGLRANYFPNGGLPSPIFADLNPIMIESYRRNRVRLNTVQVTGIIALNM